ncbi:MAG: hypothetical protein KDB53_22125, partial [Planctomycetes bacterium]|nr:hypothetical protein [Planctomycetota bacterium]
MMKCFNVAIVTALVCTLSGVVFAQQLEVNTPAGSLQSQFVDPTPGVPFNPTLNGSIQMNLGGAAGQPFALVVGQLATTSTPIPFTIEFFDLNMSGAALVTNGFGAGGALPFYLSFMNNSGTAAFSFPVNPVANGQPVAFQSIVGDPTASPIMIALSAAAEFVAMQPTSLSQDDAFLNISIPSGPIMFNGQSFGSIDIHTNGFIKFGGTSTFGDLGNNSTSMINGTMGGSPGGPAIAVLWDDIDVGNNATQSVAFAEPVPGIITVTWNNADYFPSTPIGTFSCTIDSLAFGPGFPMITFDYSMANMGGRQDGIVGVTAGNAGIATTAEHNLVVGGAVNPY